MASAGPSSAPATEDLRGPVVDSAEIQSLEEELAFEQTVLTSLEDTFDSADDEGAKLASKRKIIKLKKRLSEARGVVPSKGQGTSSNMNDIRESDYLQLPHRLLSGPSGTSTPGGSSSSGLSRKRSFSNAQIGPLAGWNEANKSRRTTPSPRELTDQQPLSSPDVFSDFDDEVIDLTADDPDLQVIFMKQREIEERMRRNQATAKTDAEFARRLQNGQPPTFNQPSPNSQQPRQTVFDRMTEPGGQPIEPTRQTTQYPVNREPVLAAPFQGLDHHRSGAPEPTYANSQSSSGIQNEHRLTPYSRTYGPPSHSHPSQVKPEPQPQQPSQMPGTFVDDDDDELVYMGSNPRNNQAGMLPPISSLGVSSSFPGPSQQPQGFAQYSDTRSPFDAYRPLPSHSQLSNYNQLATTFDLASTRPGFINNGVYNTPNVLPQPSLPGFSSLSELTKRVGSFDYNSMTDGMGVPLNPRLANYIDDYVHDPRKTDEEIQQLLSNIRPDMDIPEEARGETPEALKYPLYVHQQLALNWMVNMEKGTNKGGILADDMGLGKTISTLALMVTRPSEDVNNKTNLIIGPVALIRQWEHEIEKKLKSDHQLKVFLLYGKKAKYADIKKADVVLTTYGSVASEWKRYRQHVSQRDSSEEYQAYEDEELHKKCPLLHPKSEFYRVILDEAQLIKNKDTQASQGAHQIRAVYRWCLTGTPMMNGVQELYPLIRFLRIKPYSDHKRFSESFKGLTPKSNGTERQRKNAMMQLQAILKAIMLRRMKNSLIDGKPILTLPEKTEHQVSVEFSPDEQGFYNDLEARSQVQFNKYLRAGTVGKNYSNILVLLLRLRQACCHPHLMDFECVAANEVSENQMLELARSLETVVVDRIKSIEAFECPICYDAVEDPTILVPCGHDTCSECFASLTDNTAQSNIRSGQEGGSAKCPVCRGPAETSKTISYTTFQKVHMPEAVAQDGAADDAGECSGDSDTLDSDSDSDSESVATDDDAESLASLKDFIVKDDADEDYEDEESDRKPKKVKAETKDEDHESEESDTKPQKVKAETKDKKSKRRGKKAKLNPVAKGKQKAGEVKPEMLKTLRHEAGNNREARRRYMRYLRDNWEDSAKVTKVLELLEEIQKTDEKTIIFSQWTSLLDLIECQIKYKLQAKYCRYTGGMSRKNRDEAVQEFVEDSRTKIMLVSLRAGNAGLNLTVASHVIICDPFWNPYIEMQAVDRAHRIGQQREVQVHRILIENTVEDRIIELQERKRELVDAALDEGESKNLGRLSERELAYLFGVRRR